MCNQIPVAIEATIATVSVCSTILVFHLVVFRKCNQTYFLQTSSDRHTKLHIVKQYLLLTQASLITFGEL